MVKLSILTNNELCTGCWVCAASCMIWNKLPDDITKWWMVIRTVGPDGVTPTPNGIDEPVGTWPSLSECNLKMSWLSVAMPECTLCADAVARGLAPRCVYNCPLRAKFYGDADDPSSDFSVALQAYRGRGYRIYQLPDAGTKTHPAFWYAEKPKA